MAERPQVGDRIEQLLEEVRAMVTPPAWGRVDELMRAIVALYGSGLERAVAILKQAGAEAQLHRLAGDPLVASLFILHGLHPVDIETRIQRALETVRPYLGSHAGGVTFLGVDDGGVARLRLEGSCQGCPSSLVTVRLAIERAIAEAAPELTGIAVEGVVDGAVDGAVEGVKEAEPGLIQIGVRPHRPAADGWATLVGIEALAEGEVRPLEVAGARVVVLAAAGSLYAYRNVCPSCGSTLERGDLAGVVLRCPTCGESYDVRRAGRALDREQLHLDPIPLVADASGARIAVGEAS